MADVFISYSHADHDFVVQLYEALIGAGLEVWVDLKGIPYSSQWWQEIQEGIENAHNFAFIISPESMKSQYCQYELEHARGAGKRIVPVLHREYDPRELNAALFRTAWESIARTNWERLDAIQHLPIRAQDDFERAFAALLNTLNLDLDYVKLHTKLTQRSSDWAEQKYESLLLRGEDLRKAETWLSASRSANKQPQPTDQICEYISESRRTEERLKRETATIVLERHRLSLRQQFSLRFLGAFVGSWASFAYLIYYQYMLNDPQGWFASQSTITGISVGAVLGLGLALAIALAAEGRTLFGRRQWWLGWAVSGMLCLVVFVAYSAWNGQSPNVVGMIGGALLLTGGFGLTSLLTGRDLFRAIGGAAGVFLALVLPYVALGRSVVFDFTDVPVLLIVVFSVLIGLLTFFPEFLGLHQRIPEPS
ncbi:MAG: TIR domain-containing protein [Chloroflexi bacterium]|nr:TIR domain-containing protein [Chloroflexota bacterium]